MKIPNVPNEAYVKSDEFDRRVISAAFESASKRHAITASGATEPEEITSTGGRFIIPLILPEGVKTGDNRRFKPYSITHRDLPIPVMWQEKTADGHDESYLVGRIDSIERVSKGLGNARGVFDTGEYAREAERLVRGGFLRGISADLDNFEGTAKAAELSNEEDTGLEEIKSREIIVSQARVMGVTLVPKPAFQECTIIIDDGPALSDDQEDAVAPGVYEEETDDHDVDTVMASIIASGIPIVPPRDWFNNPGLREPTPLQIDDEGRVFGHIAAWHVDHIGLPNATKPPRSRSKYAYFRTGVVRTDGGDVQVGQLTLAGGHASLQASAEDAVKHYDDTASAIADVAAGEDEYGIWVAGALRPDATPLQVRALRASAPSGDWRPINGRLELVAVCQVNVPGFPIARTMVASSGLPTALVAAGARPLAILKEQQKMSPLEERLRRLEQKELAAEVASLTAAMEPSIKEKNERLQALAASAMNEMKDSIVLRDEELRKAAEELKAFFNN